jgi:malonyl CoA-acyl carrier protein transacylase
MKWPSELVVLTDESRASLATRARTLSAWCERHPDTKLKDVAFTLAAGRRKRKLALIAANVRELGEKLAHAAACLHDAQRNRINERTGIFYFEEPFAPEHRLAFLFPGEGAQYPHMLRDLCLNFEEVRASFDLLERAIGGESNHPSPKEYIFPLDSNDAQDGALWRMSGAVETVIAANRGIFALLRRFGILPNAVLGHSTGEYSALLAARVLRAEDAELMKHLQEGSQLSERLERDGLVASGCLIAVSAERDTVDKVLGRHRNQVWLALDNCPRQVVLFVARDSVETVTEDLREASTISQILPFDRAYHTPLFAPVREELAKFFDRFELHPPQMDVYSCATGERYPRDTEQVRKLALEQWTSTVRFREAVENMYTAGVRIFVEAGPRGNLTSFVGDILRGRPHSVVPIDLQSVSGITQLNLALGRLAAHGVLMNLEPLHSARRVKRIRSLEGEFSSNGDYGAENDRKIKLALALPVMRPPTSFRPSRPEPAVEPAPHSAFINEYLETMEKFLETQQAFLATLGGQRSSVAVQAVGEMTAVKDFEPPLAREIVEPVRREANPSGDEMLLQIVSQRTGYPRDALHLDADLEGDLGIDSIKKVEIVGAFHQATGLLKGEKLEAATRKKTLREILDVAREAERSENETSALLDSPLAGDITLLAPGEEAFSSRIFTLERDLFLKDHALGAPGNSGRALVVLPLTVTVEAMAQLASVLAPGRELVEIRDVRANRWLALEENGLAVEIRAKRQGANEYRVALVDAGQAVKGPAAEATFVFGELGPPPQPDSFDLTDERPYQWAPSELYSLGMFHGPAFQGVTSITRIGAEGIEAVLRVSDRQPLFRDGGNGSLRSNPLLLDAAGQLVGFWSAHSLSKGYVVFPFRVRSIEFFEGQTALRVSVTTRARIRQDGDTRLVAGMDLLGPDGLVRVRVRGWEDKRIEMPDEFFKYRIDPVKNRMSKPWRGLAEQIVEGNGVAPFFLAMDEAFFANDGGIWREVLAQMLLKPREIQQWKRLRSDKRSTQYLLGRMVAKDAVCALLGDGHQAGEVEILPDSMGRPAVTENGSGAMPRVSISHTDGFCVAVAADPKRFEGIGVDVERMRSKIPTLEELLISDAERRIALQNGALENPEWTLRIWCAKEAAAKAWGSGLASALAEIKMVSLDAVRGEINFEVDAPRTRTIIAQTKREGDLVAAVAAIFS